MKKAIIYFPYHPFPVRSGGQWRCASIITAVMASGYEVTLISGTKGLPDADQVARNHGVRSVFSHDGTSLVSRVLWRMASHFNQLAPIDRKYRKRRLRNFLGRVAAGQGKADLLLINYADNTWIRELFDHETSVLDTLDLVSVAERINGHIGGHMKESGGRIISVNPNALDLDFYDPVSFAPSDDEVRNCAGYDAILMIADKEYNALKVADPSLPLIMSPPSARILERTGDYDGPALFTSGPNFFNVQGIISFQERILPEILRKCPDFKLHLTGELIAAAPKADGLEYLGVLPTLEPLYQECGFAVIPTFGGTGQQLKVVEAMGAGLTVVAYASRVDARIIDDGIDGFTVSSESEFASRVIQLWNDRELCRKMGQAAQAKINASFSQEVTNVQTRDLLDRLRSANGQ